MIVESPNLFFPWKNSIKKPFIAFPSAYYCLLTINHIEALFIYYKSFFLDRERLRYKKTWNCCKFAESFKLISNLHYSRNVKNMIGENEEKIPASVSMGVVYFTKITKQGFQSPHVVNMAFIDNNGKIEFIFIEAKDQKVITLTEEEFESIELVVF